VVKINSFNGYPYANVDQVGLSNNSPEMYNGIIDSGGYRRMRPGLTELINLNISYPIDGLYWWESQKVAIATCHGRVFKITTSDGSYTELTGATLQTDGTRVEFCDAGLTGNKCIMANGGNIIYTDGYTLTQLADSDAPDQVSHVVFMDQYIIANHTSTGRFYWSDVNDLTSWSGSYAAASSKSDNIIAIGAQYGELVLAGTDSIEIWYNDGITPFAPLSGAISPRGIIAPYSFKFCDNTWIGIDSDHHIMMLNNRTPQVVSTSFDKLLESIDTIDDAIADIITISGRYLYIISFPTNEITLVFDIAAKQFVGYWTNWDEIHATHNRWLGNTHSYCPEWNMHLIGDRRSGIIYIMSSSIYNDNSGIIRHTQRSGHIDHGTSNQKKSKCLRFRIKRGSGLTDPTSSPSMLLKWRDNNSQIWSNETSLDLGALGQTDMYIELKQLGMYISRQYEITITDAIDTVLVGVEEDVEVLSR
jgi:hypothetical protein